MIPAASIPINGEIRACSVSSGMGVPNTAGTGGLNENEGLSHREGIWCFDIHLKR